MADKNQRAKLYKNNSKHEDARRRRVETSIELRKARRMDDLMKRRNIAPEDTAIVSDSDDASTQVTSAASAPTVKTAESTQVSKCPTMDEVLAALATMRGKEADMGEMRRIAGMMRRMLAAPKNGPDLEAVIENQLDDVVMQLLAVDDATVAYDAMWTMTNLLSGPSSICHMMVEKGCLDYIKLHMTSEHAGVVDQAAWALANIIGDSPDLRDKCIDEGLVQLVFEKIQSGFDKFELQMKRTLAWCISNVVRHRTPNQCPIGTAAHVLDSISVVLQCGDTTCIRDCLWGLSYLSDSSSAEYLSLMVERQVVPALVQGLAQDTREFYAPILRTLGNCAAGSDGHTQAVVEAGLLESAEFKRLYETGSNHVHKEVLWLMSNVFAGTQEQVERACAAGWVPLIVKAVDEFDARSQLEASYAFSNMTHAGDVRVHRHLMSAGFLGMAARALSNPNSQVLINILDALNSAFDAMKAHFSAEDYETALQLFEEAGGVDKVETCQHHEADEVYRKALAIVTTHWDDENGDETDELESEKTELAAEGADAKSATPLKPFNF